MERETYPVPLTDRARARIDRRRKVPGTEPSQEEVLRVVCESSLEEQVAAHGQ